MFLVLSKSEFEGWALSRCGTMPEVQETILKAERQGCEVVLGQELAYEISVQVNPSPDKQPAAPAITTQSGVTTQPEEVQSEAGQDGPQEDKGSRNAGHLANGRGDPGPVRSKR